MHRPVQCCLAKPGHSKTPFTPAVCSPRRSGPVPRLPLALRQAASRHRDASILDSPQRCGDRCTAHNAVTPQLGPRAPGAIKGAAPAQPQTTLRHVASAGGCPAPAAAPPEQSRQKSKLPPEMRGLEEGVVGGLLPRPLTSSREECTGTTANRSSPRWNPGLHQPAASAREPPLGRPALLPPTNHRLSGAHQPRGRALTSRGVPTRRPPPPGAPAARPRSGRALWRACALEESGAGPRPVRVLCSSTVRARDVGGGAAAVAPGNREAGGGGGGGGGGGTRREDGECGGPGPSGAGRSPPSRPRAQGGALRLKPRREWEPAAWILDWFQGAAGSGGWALGRRPGPGEEGGACSQSEPGEGAGRLRGYPGTEPGLHQY